MKPFILRGALAGIGGSIASMLVLLLLGEQSINAAIAIEEANAAPGGDDPLFSRTAQTIGGALGVVLYGALLGTVFGVVYAANRHRLGGSSEWRRARRLAGIAFVSVFLVPMLKYPPNPPAVGDPDTVGERTVSYLAMILLSVIAVLVAARAAERLRAGGVGAHLVGPAAVGVWLLLVGVALALMPPNPDPVEAPANLIWRFRLSAAGGQLAFWAVCGVVYGWLAVNAEGGSVFAVRRSDRGPDPELDETDEADEEPATRRTG